MLPIDLEALRASPDRFTFRPFYGHQPRPDGRLSDGCLSQWWPCRFVVKGVSYVTAEQFMMACKARLFGDAEALERILSEPAPAKQKALGRAVRNFDGATWERHRFEVVAFGSHAKFSQDDGLRAFLLSTKQAVLVEASPRDFIWGVGLGRENPFIEQPRRWRGKNLLGFALMHARDVLRGVRAPIEPAGWLGPLTR